MIEPIVDPMFLWLLDMHYILRGILIFAIFIAVVFGLIIFFEEDRPEYGVRAIKKVAIFVLITGTILTIMPNRVVVEKMIISHYSTKEIIEE